MRAYKFLAVDGSGVFSRFRWPLPNGRPGEWVESEVIPCRSGVHACRPVDLSIWVAPVLYEIELDGEVVVQRMKVVAPRGRLLRRIDAWSADAREEYSRMCIARAAELAAGEPERLAEWVPPAEAAAGGPALMGFVAARIAEQLGGVPAYMDERRRQSEWLVGRLGLDQGGSSPP
jgi:hypothetical protein